MAYYFADEVTINGEAKRFERTTADGNLFETFFCPECGSTVYAKPGKQPSLIGITVGSIADPAFQAPHVSVWEQSQHPWLTLTGPVQHFPRGDQK